MVHQLHTEWLGTDGEGRADTAHAEDAENLVVGVISDGEATAPVPSAERGLGTVGLAERHEEKHYCDICGRIVDSAGGVRYENAYLARRVRKDGPSAVMVARLGLTACCARIDVNLVIAGTVVADESDATGKLRDELGIKSSSDLSSRQISCAFLTAREPIQTLAES